jgi:hypothetical protein
MAERSLPPARGETLKTTMHSPTNSTELHRAVAPGRQRRGTQRRAAGTLTFEGIDIRIPVQFPLVGGDTARLLFASGPDLAAARHRVADSLIVRAAARSRDLGERPDMAADRLTPIS